MTTAPYPLFDGTQPCSTSNVDDFVTGSARPQTAALCTRCTFRDPCRAYALTHDVRGLWGGLDDAARRRVRRATGRAEPAPVSDYLDAVVFAGRRASGDRPAAITTQQMGWVVAPSSAEVA